MRGPGVVPERAHELETTTPAFQRREHAVLLVTIPTIHARAALINTAAEIDTGEATGFFVEEGQNVDFFKVKVHNVAGSGIMIYGLNMGALLESEILKSWADGVHITRSRWDASPRRTYSFAVRKTRTDSTGDDGMACVGYDGIVNQFVGFYENTIYNAGSRPRQGSGITVEGCENVEIHDNSIDKSSASGIRIGSAAFWKTTRVNEVDVTRNVLSRVASAPNWAAVYLFATLDNVSNVHVYGNTITNPLNAIVFRLHGDSAEWAWVYDTQVQNNTVTGSLPSASSCIDWGAFTQNLILTGNKLNGGLCY
jgi:hypothetical protein